MTDVLQILYYVFLGFRVSYFYSFGHITVQEYSGDFRPSQLLSYFFSLAHHTSQHNLLQHFFLHLQEALVTARWILLLGVSSNIIIVYFCISRSRAMATQSWGFSADDLSSRVSDSYSSYTNDPVRTIHNKDSAGERRAE